MNQEILLKPILSEKSLNGVASRKYIFVVAGSANKPMVAEALKKIYKVDTQKINIINTQPEEKMRRGHIAKIKAFKKAIVTLKPGQKIEGFEFKEK
jgi:large subunit ribosomal protein L23